MIVKNESKIIRRCIDSCIKIIDGISICDTGSTDNTVELIQTAGSFYSVPTKVYNHEWKNFGHNRSLSFTSSLDFIKEQSWDPKECFDLLLDADMCLKIESGFDKQNLTKVGYQIMQKNPTMEYQNMRLIRCDRDWKCIGATHEYWSQAVEDPKQPMETNYNLLWIDDQNDGGSKSDKFERDIRLLKEDLVRDPDNVRTLFYLANSLKDSGNPDRWREAIQYYEKRIKKGGWTEEVFYSLNYMGQCYEHLKEYYTAAGCYLEAFQYHNKRSESLYNLAHMYRNQGKNMMSYVIAKLGSSIPYPTGDVLFIVKPVYSYLFQLELSIVSYYISGKRKEGMIVSNKLLFDPDVPSNVKNNVRFNLEWYLDPIKIVEKVPIEIKLPYLVETDPGRGTYRSMNPSIVKTKSGYTLNVRCVNYKQEKGIYSYLDGSGVINTRNILVNMDKNLKTLTETEIVDTIGKDCSKTVIGLEDIRLFEWQGGLWCVAGNRLTVDTPQIVLCQLGVPVDVPGNGPGSTGPAGGNGKKVIQVASKTLLVGPKGEHNCEKNWMPVVRNNHLYLLYSYQPFVRLKYRPSDKTVVVTDNHLLKYDLSSFRGSCAPIVYDDGYLAVIHEVLFTDRRIYIHRFIAYDDKMLPKAVSFPFYFFQKNIEYVCGMVLDHAKKNFLITMGINDAESYLIKVSYDTVKNMLVPL